MNEMMLLAFTDELEKIAVRLNKAEERERALKYTAIGSLAGPFVTGIGGAIKGGRGGLVKNVTQEAKSLPRWLAGSMLTGAMFSGGVPIIQRRVLEDINRKAEHRIQEGRL